MNPYIEKLLTYLLTLVAAITFIFFAMRIAPGDPVEKLVGDMASKEEVESVREDLGLDKPVWIQFGHYLKRVSQLDLGTSISKGKPIRSLVLEHVKPTFTIAFIAIILAMSWGITGGVLLAYFKGSWIDYGGRLFTLIILSLPVFSLAPILVLFFAIRLGAFPVSEWGEIKHIVLPVLTLTLPLGAILLRVTRNKFLEENSAQWMEVLKAKGLSEYSVTWRTLVVCLPTIMTVVGVQLSVILAGTMITEMIFDIPGMGALLLEAIQGRDYPVVQGVILYSTVIYLVVYFLIDFLNAYIDPRLKRAYES
jgi:peptide/nickel transport system permease protein